MSLAFAPPRDSDASNAFRQRGTGPHFSTVSLRKAGTQFCPQRNGQAETQRQSDRHTQRERERERDQNFHWGFCLCSEFSRTVMVVDVCEDNKVAWLGLLTENLSDFESASL
jgi:hypothetical protein